MLILFLLLLDVGSDHLLVQAHGGEKVPSGSELLSCKVPISPHEPACDRNRALPLDVAHHVCHGVLWRDADADVNVVTHQMPFQNLAPPLPR